MVRRHRHRIEAYFNEAKIPIVPSYLIRSSPANTADAVLCDLYARNAVHAAMAVDHILDTLLVAAGTRGTRAEPEPWAGQRLGAQLLRKVQIRNAKEVFWDIVSVDQHDTPINPASQEGQPTPGD
jgi:hypothetical protein